jgi:molybdopterin/thiamine biosynthesis adenylyltransferase
MNSADEQPAAPRGRRMNQTEFYRSIMGVLNPGRLLTRKVAVVGLGSGGSRVAAELGRLGLQLLLVERPEERLEEHNIVRHLLGYRSLGKSKLREMIKYIRNLNPAALLKASSLDVVEQQPAFERLLTRWRPDLIAVCTDNEPSKHAVNEVALRLEVPQTGGAVYDGGIGGEVYRVRPGEACYGCLAAQLRLDRQTPSPNGPMDYSRPHGPPTTAALNLDIEQIALLQCRMSLDLLLAPASGFIGLPPEVNLGVFSNRLVPGTFARPWHCEFFSVGRRSTCLGCGQGPGDVEAEAGRILSTLQVAHVPKPPRAPPQRRMPPATATPVDAPPGQSATAAAAQRAWRPQPWA